jgi:hypothetical protein
LREFAAHQALGAPVINEKALVAGPFESPVGAALHPPVVMVADDEDSQASTDLQAS